MDEKMLEFAEALTLAIADNTVAKIRSQVKSRDPLFDGICEDCEDAIPEPRLNTGAVRCIECQEIHEQREKHFRR